MISWTNLRGSKKPKLYKYQQEGLGEVLRNSRFPLFWEAGTGKTPVAIKSIESRYRQEGIYRVWVIVPKTLIENWVGEIHKFLDVPDYHLETLNQRTKPKRLEAYSKFLKTDLNRLTIKELDEIGIHPQSKTSFTSKYKPNLQILLTNYEKARVMFKEISRFKPQYVVIDEIHNLRTRSASMSSKIYSLTRGADYSLGLTGTPLCGGYEDLFMQYKIIDDEIFGSNYRDFEDRYIRKGGFMGKQIVGYENIGELKDTLDSTSSRKLLEECVELPERLPDLNMYVDLGAKAQKAYKELNDDLETTLELVKDEISRSTLKERCREIGIPYHPRESYESLFYKVADFLNTASCDMAITKRLRLQQLSGGFLTMDSGEVVNLDKSKLDVLLDHVASNVGKPLLIFCQFLPEIDLIYEELSTREFPHITEGRKIKSRYKHKVAKFTGQIKNRDRVYRDFQDGHIDILILQINAGGVGLNLQRANKVIFYSWNTYEKYYQAIGRIRRSGQKNKYQVIHIIARDTVDEVVLKSIEDKRKLFKRIFKS